MTPLSTDVLIYVIYQAILGQSGQSARDGPQGPVGVGGANGDNGKPGAPGPRGPAGAPGGPGPDAKYCPCPGRGGARAAAEAADAGGALPDVSAGTSINQSKPDQAKPVLGAAPAIVPDGEVNAGAKQ